MKQKTTAKSKQNVNKKHSTTVIFGYGLFLLTVLSLISWTVIPLGSVLTSPTVRHFNIIVLIISFVAAAILPALGSYILGDRATHIKNTVLHHYNGVLFGIAAYWIASALNFIGYTQLLHVGNLPIPFPIIVATAVPIILTVAVMAFVAITYAKKQKNKSSVLEHHPYQIVLIGSIAALYVSIAMNSNFNTDDNLWTNILPFAFPVVLTFVSYKILAKYHTSRLAGFTDAVAAMSLGYITLSSIMSFIAYLDLHLSVTLAYSYVLTLAVWTVYLYLQNRKSA